MWTTGDTTPCDVGAQYYTPVVRGQAHAAMLKDWHSAGLVRPFSDIGTTHSDHLAQDHFVAVHGTRRCSVYGVFASHALRAYDGWALSLVAWGGGLPTRTTQA